jgi:signal recognition particle GTPase
VICAFKDEELLDKDLVTARVKNEVAQITGCEAEDVNKLLRIFKMNHNLHLYLKQRRVKGEGLPEDEKDIMLMMRTDPPPEDIKRRTKSKSRWSKLQMRVQP